MTRRADDNLESEVRRDTAATEGARPLDIAGPGAPQRQPSATPPTRRNAPRPPVAASSDVARGAWPFEFTVGRYVGLVALCGIATLLIPPSWTQEPAAWLPAFLVLTLLSALLEFVSVELPHQGVLSVATITHVATILLVPPPFAAVSIVAAITWEQLVHRKSFAKLAFNTSSYLITASLGSLAVGLIGNPWDAAATHQHLPFVGMFVASTAIYYLSNDILTSGIIALVTERPLFYVLRANVRNTFFAEAGAATIGALLALIWIIEPLWTLLLTVPGAVITRTLRYIRQLENETRTAVKALAGVVDDRDASTFHHSERVATYALLLARELGLSEDAIDLIEQAAGVHDLGKIGVPDRILLKNGPLTREEQTAMWLHTEIGAKILSNFQLFRPGAEIVLHHHENYDGTGYPTGLAGEQIPLGARIVAVADAFDAMTSHRPYRRALDYDEAVRRLRDGGGRQWDPIIVGVFIKLASEGRILVEDVEERFVPGPPRGDTPEPLAAPDAA